MRRPGGAYGGYVVVGIGVDGQLVNWCIPDVVRRKDRAPSNALGLGGYRDRDCQRHDGNCKKADTGTHATCYSTFHPMQVHILRHGTAEDIRAGGSDFERKLTPAGREEVRRAIACVRPAMAPTLILSSPFARALETAQIAAEVAGYTGNIVRTEALEPNASPHLVWQEIRIRPDESQILLAGHEPLLSQLMAYLLNCPTLHVDMRKATLVRIDIDRFAGKPCGLLRWVLPPDLRVD